MWTAGGSASAGFFRSGSILLQPGVAVPVKAGVAEGDFGNAGALEEEPVFMLIGHADAAMHLDGLVGDQVKDRVGVRLGLLDQINRLGWEERSHLAEILRQGASLRTVRKTRRHREVLPSLSRLGSQATGEVLGIAYFDQLCPVVGTARQAQGSA